MTITKETYVDLQEKYDKVIKLLEEDSKLDPESEPFLSKYSARQILIGMRANLENLLRTHTTEDPLHKKLTAMLGTIHLYLGMIAIETEETSNGRKHLEKCKEVIESYHVEPEFILVTLNMYNNFGILSYQNEPEESKTYLEKAESLFAEFKRKGVSPIDIADLFKTNIDFYNTDVAVKNFEKIHTLTLYYLAQAYGALKDALRSAVYCHVTLKRQLEMCEYDPIDWALNAATLSQFFMEKNCFKQARHHLAASSFILDEYKKKLDFNQTEPTEVHNAMLETFRHRSADVARCWSKYGLILLSKSKDRLLNHTDDLNTHCSLSTDFSDLNIQFNGNLSQYDLKSLIFEKIPIEEYENQITDQFILTLPDAKKVFLNAQQWSDKAQEYYTLDSLASDFIDIVLDQTQLYLNLLFFEDEPENQAKLHKRRIKLLEHVLNNVNEQYYLQYCRQVWFELARTYADILDIKCDKLRESTDRPTPQSLSKINNLADKGILHYTNFIKSFEDKASKKLPDKFPDDVEKPVLQAYFHKAALYSKYISLDKQIQLKNTEMSLENYKFISDYCEKHPKAKELIAMEYGICKEMVTLLPIKIMKLKSA
ncbi:KIF-binding protein-like [Diorhabda carinulata]|uniref:KIF-binding protein-like n=1 Tax=Diorhabda carinulata TaxID=1163345 RepID=UPI0025A200F7|nr:KIF-binding protein-like [Diorhabda carinulata]